MVLDVSAAASLESRKSEEVPLRAGGSSYPPRGCVVSGVSWSLWVLLDAVLFFFGLRMIELSSVFFLYSCVQTE